MLKLIEVSKSFKNQKVLEAVNLELDEGKIVHIEGANGSGKSTLLKIIAGLMKPSSGTVCVSKNVKIGALIENPSFLEDISAKDNLKILFQLKSKNLYDEKKLNILFKNFGLLYEDTEKMKNFSLGMKQKVGIIQAIMENQNLILLDEPTRGLDKESIKTFGNIIKQLKKEGKCVVIASHLQDEQEFYYDRKFKISDKKIIY